MRDFEPARAEFDRKIDELADLMQIAAVDHRIDGERHAGLRHHRGEGALLLPRAVIVAEPVVGLLVRPLKGELRMVEPGFDQVGPQLFAHPDAGGDEIGVEPAPGGVAREFRDVAPRGRFAAG